MSTTPLVERPAAPGRILIDLAEGRLDDGELDAVAAWLTAGATADVSEHVIRLGLAARPASA